jgi:7-cyano-7-deazaguanine synthase
MLFFPAATDFSSIALLTSGGIESCILVAELTKYFECVCPVYMRFGLAWEQVELGHLRMFLAQIASANLQPLTVLDNPMADIYANHWSVDGTGVPDASTPDEAVFLPGRNLLFLSKVSVWCAIRNVRNIGLGSLASNPFPDATDDFFNKAEQAYNTALSSNIRVVRPLSRMHKEDVLRLGSGLPLHLSFSCIQPEMRNALGAHCGRCNKCHERQMGFLLSGVPDRTIYAWVEDAVSSQLTDGLSLIAR